MAVHSTTATTAVCENPKTKGVSYIQGIWRHVSQRVWDFYVFSFVRVTPIRFWHRKRWQSVYRPTRPYIYLYNIIIYNIILLLLCLIFFIKILWEIWKQWIYTLIPCMINSFLQHNIQVMLLPSKDLSCCFSLTLTCVSWVYSGLLGSVPINRTCTVRCRPMFVSYCGWSLNVRRLFD